MRYALVLLVGCANPGHVDDAPTPKVAAIPVDAGVPIDAGVPSCIDDGKPYDEVVIRERVTHLASKELGGRVPGSAGDVATRTLIVDRFRCLGLTATKPGYELPFDAAGAKTANVVAYIKGSDPDVGDQIIYVGAHHDHEGNGHLGANDNASGVVALLAIAQAIQQRPAKPKRTIVFATFGGEELGMLGSYYLSAHPPDELPNAKVVQFINLDMVGSHSSRKLVAAMGALPKLASRPFLDKLSRKYPKLNVSIGGRARGSDYEPLCKLGVPYVFFWTPDAKCYHQTCDLADRIDYPRMVDITSLAGALVGEMADTDVDLAAARQKLGCGV
ncbi:MAG: M20/M25/M40 family metallo-hydrolase [Kofleriaceae bacterium]